MAILLIVSLFGLLALGVYMRLPSETYTSELPSHKEAAFYVQLIEMISMDGSALIEDASALAKATALGLDGSLNRLLAIEPSYAETAMDVYRLRQLQALFSKREQIPGVVVDKRAAALATFDQAERLCFETNTSLRNTSDPHYEARRNLISKMSAKIWRILGEAPSLEEIPFAFGPGANVGCKKNTSVKMKLSSRTTMTEGAGRMFSSLPFHYHALNGLKKPVLVRGSQWTSVPKTFKTDRGINIEPILNSYMQKGIGTVIRDRLRKEGVDLNDQGANQLLAQLGSNLGDVPHGLATIDLSMASDCIAYLLVMDVLPYDWFVLLDSCRSPSCLMPDGNWRVLEKFSAMGNGYTFELESLIFYALLSVICGDDEVISVYGDDLICPNKYFDQVCDALRLIGFTPNEKKSFGSGPFRESCGRDFWYGTNIRPLYIKKNLSPKELFRIHNFFKRTGWIDADWIIDYIPSAVRLFGPDGYGDGHLIKDWRLSFHKGYQSPVLKFKTFAAKQRKSRGGDRYSAFLYENRHSTETQASLTIDCERSSDPVYVVRKLRVPVVT